VKVIRVLLASAALVGPALLGGAGVASADPRQGTPPTTGCPPGQLLAVAELLPQGYRVPAVIDAEGNNDGYVCGVALSRTRSDKICPPPDCPVPIIYLFRDNDLTPQH
jgi:hypothetical protein